MIKDEQSPAIAPDNTHRSSRRLPFFACVLVLLIMALAAVWFVCPWLPGMRNMEAPQNLAQMQQRLMLVEQKIQALDEKLNALAARAGKDTEPENKESVADQEMHAPSVTALARVQSDLVALSSAVSGLQNELKQAGSTVAHTQQMTQSSLATAIAFIQLREAAETGRSFASELAALRSAVKNESGFQEPIGKLEPYAAKGVSTLEILRAEFIALEQPTTVAIDKSTAQSWRERVMAELKGLVSIRPLHGGGEGDAFTAVEDELSADDLSAALTSIGALPESAQQTLKDWRVKAAARETVEVALHALADHLIVLAAPTPTTQDEP